jgi:hypothetical protein
MPKGKNAAGLFEVMGKTKADAALGKGNLGTPPWWKAGSASKPANGAAPANGSADALGPSGPGVPFGPTGPLGGAGQNRLELDGDRQELTLRVTYTVAAVALFAVVTTFGLAVIVGKEWGTHARTVQTTADLQKGPAHPEVLDIGPGSASPGRTPGNTPPLEPVSPNPTPQPPSDPPVNPATGKVTRTIGLTYVIAQSYPTEAEAKTVVEYLASRGIGATAERLPAWNKNGWTVISADGYPKTAKAELEALRRKFDQASVEEAQKDRKWKILQPTNFRWQG